MNEWCVWCGDDADNTELARARVRRVGKNVSPRAGGWCVPRTCTAMALRVACAENKTEKWRAEDLASPQNLGRELDELEGKPNVPCPIRCSS